SAGCRLPPTRPSLGQHAVGRRCGQPHSSRLVGARAAVRGPFYGLRVRFSGLIERRVSRFHREPLSVRNAVSVIVAASGTVVVVSAVLMRFLDHDEYHHLGRALWWAMQTIPTVGYGDVTPRRTIGRLIAAGVMLWGIGLIAITAVITSSFVARAARGHESELLGGGGGAEGPPAHVGASRSPPDPSEAAPG